MAKKKTANPSPKLTETEQDLLSHMQDGYQLETDSLGSDPSLRRLKDNEVIRPLSANRSTIEAMKQILFIAEDSGSLAPVLSDCILQVFPQLFSSVCRHPAAR
jgi:hypothetical protein